MNLDVCWLNPLSFQVEPPTLVELSNLCRNSTQQDLESEVAFRGEQRQVPRLARFALKPGVPWLGGETWGFND
jgi:hypothetical protein